ncbi:hypothetical protein EZV61_16165 [Corallincola luteus]|uniref:histidine kinase n=1 Tax=Corallincola luteus TaxID=1775177 RepID=A0ABY2AK97_9GAMM|nr:ATP-binding protein [Corallincola luteus]TCI01802.1 hypothetical protein EZV61_16165 [Corallincola luteus]
MKLKRQLLVASLFMLALPWAGCQYVKETESALRAGQLQALEATGQAVVALLAQQDWQLDTPTYQHESTVLESDADPVKKQTEHPSLFAPERPWRIIMDGYPDEWQSMPVRRLQHDDFAANLRLFTRKDRLYMLLEVEDRQRLYFDPTRGTANNGDHLVIRNGHGRDYLLAASAPGEMIARYQQGNRTRYQREIAGYWLDTSNGYNIELSMPLSLVSGRLGLYLVNASPLASEQQHLSHYEFSAQSLPPRLITTDNRLTQALELFTHAGLEMRVVDNQGWQRATAGEIDLSGYQASGSAPSHGALRALYRAILQRPPMPPKNESSLFGQWQTSDLSQAQDGDLTKGWYQQSSQQDRSLLSVALPIPSPKGVTAGVLVLEQSSESYLSLTDRAFGRLFLASSLALLIGASGLFGYASWLSWRIRKLNQATQQVFDSNGQFNGDSKTRAFQISRANDEIGDLSRSYGELLERVQQYTDYLQTLSRKLSHELRTPLAVVHSSLDNLTLQADERATKSTDESDRQMYQLRAKEGANRLSHLLTAMSEASRLEESISHGDAEMEKLDLAIMFTELTAAYNDIYQNHKINLQTDNPPLVALISPELIVQMMDKIVDNAVGFAPIESEILITLQRTEKSILICVENKGPLLPKKMQHQLFDNMVSMRDKKAADDSTHLGLGLHIVRLIVEHHQGKANAENLSDNSGVRFTISLPH